MQSHMARQGNGIVWGPAHRALHKGHPLTFWPWPYLGIGKNIEGSPLVYVNTSCIRVVGRGLGGDSRWLDAREETDSHVFVPCHTLVRLLL